VNLADTRRRPPLKALRARRLRPDVPDDKSASDPRTRRGFAAGVFEATSALGATAIPNTPDPLLVKRSSASFRRPRDVHQRQQLRTVVRIGAGQSSNERNAPRICEDMVLRALLAPMGRVRAGFLAPPTARTLALSTAARDQSSWSAPRRAVEKYAVQLVRDAGLLSVAQSPPTGHARPAAHLPRRILPGNIRL
jgi:hypothetical protein